MRVRQALAILHIENLPNKTKLKKAYRARFIKNHPNKPGGSHEKWLALQAAEERIGQLLNSNMLKWQLNRENEENRRARQEANRRAREEANRRAREEANRARQEANRRAREQEANRARQEANRIARQQSQPRVSPQRRTSPPRRERTPVYTWENVQRNEMERLRRQANAERARNFTRLRPRPMPAGPSTHSGTYVNNRRMTNESSTNYITRMLRTLYGKWHPTNLEREFRHRQLGKRRPWNWQGTSSPPRKKRSNTAIRNEITKSLRAKYRRQVMNNPRSYPGIYFNSNGEPILSNWNVEQLFKNEQLRKRKRWNY